MITIVVFASGNGTNLEAVITAIKAGTVNVRIAAVISNNKDAFALNRARLAGIEAVAVTLQKGESRHVYDMRLASEAARYTPDYILLLGWMRILSQSFLSHFQERVINLHPALPGTFPGTDAIKRAYESACRGEISQSGVMTHFVPDEGVDCGPVILTEIVPIQTTMPLVVFEDAIHHAEHRIVVETLRTLSCSFLS